MPGILAYIVDLAGKPAGPGKEGYLVIRHPWPSMIRTIWGDPKRYEDQYWSRVPGAYFTGDAARRDEDGYFWVLGRVDDVMNVSGHRLSTMEIESALDPSSRSKPTAFQAVSFKQGTPLRIGRWWSIEQARTRFLTSSITWCGSPNIGIRSCAAESRSGRAS